MDNDIQKKIAELEAEMVRNGRSFFGHSACTKGVRCRQSSLTILFLSMSFFYLFLRGT